VKSLSELKSVKKTLALQASQQAALAAQAQQRQVQAEAAHLVFTQAVGKVQPLKAPPRVTLPTQAKPEQVTQATSARARAMGVDATLLPTGAGAGQAKPSLALSDEWDASRLLKLDPALGYRRPGVGSDVLRQLQRGQRVSQAQLDLHGQTVDEARQSLVQFIDEALSEGLRCVRIVHGQGHSSPGQRAVLKNKVPSWLVQINAVSAFAQAPAKEGGAGALVVLLRALT
jgi:DNA-nicking Smr family endonuclease